MYKLCGQNCQKLVKISHLVQIFAINMNRNIKKIYSYNDPMSSAFSSFLSKFVILQNICNFYFDVCMLSPNHSHLHFYSGLIHRKDTGLSSADSDMVYFNTPYIVYVYLLFIRLGSAGNTNYYTSTLLFFTKFMLISRRFANYSHDFQSNIRQTLILFIKPWDFDGAKPDMHKFVTIKKTKQNVRSIIHEP